MPFFPSATERLPPLFSALTIEYAGESRFPLFFLKKLKKFFANRKLEWASVGDAHSKVCHTRGYRSYDVQHRVGKLEINQQGHRVH